MNRATLKDRLLKWLRQHPGFHASADLQRLVSKHTDFTPQNTGRRLRELENEGFIEVKYEKGHAHYRAVQKAASMEESWQELPAIGP
jgi:hypothetical protein